MSKYIFSRVPGYDTFTGDRRIWTTVRRHEFVCFVIDLDTLVGQGFRATTLPECKAAADFFVEHYKFPEKVSI